MLNVTLSLGEKRVVFHNATRVVTLATSDSDIYASDG